MKATKQHQHQLQRSKNQRSKQNLATSPGGDFSSFNTQQYPEKALDVSFNSLPPIHIGEAEPTMGVVGGAVLRSCPLPTSNFPLEPSTSNGRRLTSNLTKGKFFAPHWSDQAVKEAIEKGKAFQATIRVNAYNRLEAYCTVNGVPVDILINGLASQNRAIEGDMVAIMLDPVAYWTKLKGSNTPVNPVVTDYSNLSPENREEVDDNCGNKEQMDANGVLQMDNGFHESGISSESISVYIGNGSRTGYTNSNAHKFTASESSNAEKDEAGRALVRICAMINSHPSKRPTGRVVAILKKSPRRGTVIGFLAIKEFLRDEKQHERQINGKLLNFVQLLPTDPKFPKMVVSVSSLPHFAKERLYNGDVSLEREIIAAQIDEWSDESHLPTARVIHILGRGGEIEPQIAAIMFENMIYDSKFPPETLKCLPNLPWDIPENELKTRKDLRNICTFTVDPSSAIDLDDALSVEIVSDEILRVGVHIADVSYFVLPDTALDTEAQNRSTSVYILQHKLSMLPPLLSESLCSLLPGVDRLALSVTWDIDRSGRVINRWIGQSIIKSCCKLSYDFVQGIIDESLNLNQCNSSGSSIPRLHGHFEWKDVVSSLRNLYEISMRLRESRFKDGALWLDTSKLGFSFDECGAPYDSFLHERKESCFLVEEFMLFANRTVAEVISRAFPDCALLRRHPEPNLRKLRDFEAFWSKHGFELDTSSSGQLHLSLSKIRGKLKDDAVLFDILVLYASRPMLSAAYFCTGELRGKENEWAHYALSVPFYTHFTSPIRRYPDIIVHRTLSAAIDAEKNYLKRRQLVPSINEDKTYGTEVEVTCFTGLYFNKNAAESKEGREALRTAALKFKVPECEGLAEVAEYCNERKLASRHAEEAGEKLYLWTMLKKKETLVSEARVLGLGPKFMSVYIHKFAIERRIYYDEVENLVVDWLEMTSTLILDLHRMKRSPRRACNWKSRPIEDLALFAYPSTDNEEERKDIAPAIFPLVLRHFSTVPVVLHATGGDGSPLDIGARLYMSSYFQVKF